MSPLFKFPSCESLIPHFGAFSKIQSVKLGFGT
jgi:hypothetical protein